MPASKYKFDSQASHDHVFVDTNGSKIGELRVKPSSILWKSKGQHNYKSVTLDEFIAWIEQAGTSVSK